MAACDLPGLIAGSRFRWAAQRRRSAYTTRVCVCGSSRDICSPRAPVHTYILCLVCEGGIYSIDLAAPWLPVPVLPILYCRASPSRRPVTDVDAALLLPLSDTRHGRFSFPSPTHNRTMLTVRPEQSPIRDVQQTPR